MTAEEKVIQKIRNLFIADSDLNAIFEGRFYASHISSVDNPAYPALSLHLLDSGASFSMRGYVSMSIQIDAWLPFGLYNTSNVMSILERIRALLDRQNLTDTTLSLRVAQSVERGCGPMMVEDDVKLLHYPIIYELVAL